MSDHDKQHQRERAMIQRVKNDPGVPTMGDRLHVCQLAERFLDRLEMDSSAPSATEPPHELQNRCLEHAAMIAEDHPDIAQRIRALKISEPFNAATHWDDCWRKHHGCAVAKIERLFAVTEIAAPEAGSDARKILNYAFTLLETNKSAELMIDYLRAAQERVNAAPRAEADADQAKDAARWRWLVSTLHGAVGAGVEVNDAKLVYEEPEPGENVRVYWYPHTPVGFIDVKASTLAEAVDAAMRETDGPHGEGEKK